MKLYHPSILKALGIGCGVLAFLLGCVAPQVRQGQIAVQVTADGKTVQVDIPAGSTAEDALSAAGVILNDLDRSEPPLYTVLNDGSAVRLIRVREEFTVEQVVIPFEQKVVRNESLPEGQEYWLQLGENGLLENTIRRLYEDDVEVSSAIVKSVVIKEAVPQIKMIGVQKPFAPISIPGRLAYIMDGNAWVMEGSTANRRQVVSSGDLDGRVFSLSPDGSWLLFTRHSQVAGVINNLWAVNLEVSDSKPIDLQVANVVHFADWKPGSVLTVGYSTVEARSAAPGWQANNDLGLLSFTSAGRVRHLPVILEANTGGLYGWWGTEFAWATDGLRIAYARPDSVGILNLNDGEMSALLDITPLQTFSDWAWVPGIVWSPQGDVLFSTNHLPPAESPLFDLMAIPLVRGAPITLASQVGMFAYPVTSPSQEMLNGEKTYQVAYLQALFPTQSDTSRYRLMVMDRDGSNRHSLFPPEGMSGLEPQRVVWSPQPMNGGGFLLAFLYQNNIWLADIASGAVWQVSGDGMTTRLSWR